MTKFRHFLIWHFTRFFWWCDDLLVVFPSHRTQGHIFFEPISLGALLTSALVSGAAFGANLILSHVLRPKQKPQVRGKLSGEIQITDSIASAAKPRIYGGRPADGSAGGILLGTNVIWASSFRKIETKTTETTQTGGKGGGGSQTTETINIDYEIDLAAAVGEGRLRLLALKFNEDSVYNYSGQGNIGTGPLTPTGNYDFSYPEPFERDFYFPEDPKIRNVGPIYRYNAPALPVNGILNSSMPNGASLVWYEGTETQLVDPVVQASVDAKYGAGSTPAFRGTAYAVISGLRIGKYGGFPQIRATVENIDTKTVSEIVLAESERVGLLPQDFDLTAGGSKHCRGLVIDNHAAPKAAIKQLGLINFLAFTENSDGQIVSKDLADRTPIATITSDDLLAHSKDDEIPIDPMLQILPDANRDLVKTFELQFFNPLDPSNFDTDRRSFTYEQTTSRRVVTEKVDITLLPEEADLITKRELQKHHLKSSPFKFTIPYSFGWLSAADVIEIPVDGEIQKVRIEKKLGSAPGFYEIEATSEEIEFTVGQTVTPQAAQTRVVVPTETISSIIDIPALNDAHKGITGVYLPATPQDIDEDFGWRGGAAYWEKGGDYERVASFDRSSFLGRSTDFLPEIPGGYQRGTIDPTNSFTADFFGNETPTSVSQSNVLDGANKYVVGNEVVGVQTWTRDNSQPNRWIASDLVRQQNDTLAGSAAHLAGERIVKVDDTLQFVPLDKDEIGVSRNWKFVTAGAQINDAAPVPFQWDGGNYLPERDFYESTRRVFQTTAPDGDISGRDTLKIDAANIRAKIQSQIVADGQVTPRIAIWIQELGVDGNGAPIHNQSDSAYESEVRVFNQFGEAVYALDGDFENIQLQRGRGTFGEAFTRKYADAAEGQAYFQIRIQNKLGWSGYTYLQGSTLSTTPPTAKVRANCPLEFAAQPVSDTDVQLVYQFSSSVDLYTREVGDFGNFSKHNPSAISSSPNTQANFMEYFETDLQLWSASNSNNRSNIVRVTTKPQGSAAPLLPAPTGAAWNPNVSNPTTSVDIAWARNSTTNTDVKIKKAGTEINDAGIIATTTGYTLTGLSPITSYLIDVINVYSGGDSSPLTFTIQTDAAASSSYNKPSNPNGTYLGLAGQGTITFGWTDDAANPSPGPYTIQKKISLNGNVSSINYSGSAPYIDSPIYQDEFYATDIYYRVKDDDIGTGETAYSPWEKVTVPPWDIFGGACFVGDTNVMAADWWRYAIVALNLYFFGNLRFFSSFLYRQIRDICEGDWVFAHDELGNLHRVRVKRTFVKIVDELLEVHFEGKEDPTFVTPKHKYRMEDLGFKPIGDTIKGEKICSRKKGLRILRRIERIIKHSGEFEVHNMWCPPYVTYIANGDEVHNLKDPEQ